MDAATIIRQARAVGVRIFLHDDRLCFGPSGLTPEWLRREIADHRDDLMVALCPNLSPSVNGSGDETSWVSADYEWPDESLAVRTLFTPLPDPPREIPELARIYIVIGDWRAVEETPRGPISSEATQWTREGAKNWWPASTWPWNGRLSKASEGSKRKRKKN